VELSHASYLGEGGRSTMVVDGIGNMELKCALEGHGLDERKGVVPEVELSIEQGLLTSAAVLLLNGLHGAMLQLCLIWYGFVGDIEGH